MAFQTPSVFSDLLNIRHPTCLNDGGPCLECDSCQTAHLLDKMQRDASDIKSSLENLSRFEQELCKHIEPLEGWVMEGNILPDQVCASLAEPHFGELIRAVEQFKLQLPYTSYFELSGNHDENQDGSTNRGNNVSADAGDSEALIDKLRREFDNLDLNVKNCLCYCSAFDAEIKKRVIINWWIGENLLGDSTEDSHGRVKKQEQAGEDTLQLLERKQFIKRLYKDRRESDVWLMEEPLRSFLRSKPILSQDVMLLRSDNQTDALLETNLFATKTVFNIDRLRIGESEAKALASMEKLTVLHLGSSQAKHQIQVKNLKLIKERLKKMKQLRLLSLQGISSITELSDSVCKLTTLKILDLRACQALESLPSSIGNLKSLTHLDVSGCYILLPLPKGVSLLSNLEVLKGFVIADDESTERSKSCSLHDLQLLKNLHKLGIFVRRENFPQPQDLKDLANIKQLVKLKILWKSTSEHDQENAHPDPNEHGQNSPHPIQNVQSSQEIGDFVQNELLSRENVYLVQNAQGQENVNPVRNDWGIESAESVPNVQSQDNAEHARNIHKQGQHNAYQAPILAADSSRHWSRTMFTCCFGNKVGGNSTEVLENLEKLDLWYAPEDAAPLLLAPKKFTSLNKLYIRWAKFPHLNYNPAMEDEWDVNMVRLMFSPKLEMSWEELKALFPKMSYLGVRDCPKLQFSQYLDEEGVWKDQPS